MPINWGFLFFSSGCAHVERYNARRGVQQYEESAWAADFDHEHEGLLREIAFVVPFDASLGGQQKDAGSTPDRSGDSAAAESADGDEDDPAPVVRVREQQRLIHVTSARRAARASHRTSTVERERARRARGDLANCSSRILCLQPARFVWH